MKVYSHDYTKVSKAEELLYRATRLMANDCHQEALRRINEARDVLQQYLNADNMVIDDDVAYGWVKAEDTFEDTQLCSIRDEFGCIIDRTDNSNGELDIINVCQRALGCPEYESYEQFKKDSSGTWEEISEQ